MLNGGRKLFVDALSQEDAAWLQAQDNRLFEASVIFNQFLTKAVDRYPEEIGVKNELFLHASGQI